MVTEGKDGETKALDPDSPFNPAWESPDAAAFYHGAWKGSELLKERLVTAAWAAARELAMQAGWVAAHKACKANGLDEGLAAIVRCNVELNLRDQFDHYDPLVVARKELDGEDWMGM